MKVLIHPRAEEGVKTISCPREVIENTADFAAFFRKMGKNEEGRCQILFEAAFPEDSGRPLLSERDTHCPQGADRRKAEMLCLAVSSLYDGAYRFSRDALRGVKASDLFERRDALSDYGEGEFTFVLPGSGQAQDEALCQGTLHGMCRGYARTLGNLPNNYLHTEQMAAYAAALAEVLGISCQILGAQELTELGCGGLLAVGQGNPLQSAMVVLRYQGGREGDAPLALVGKGLMFDSGGYHLKSIDGMKGMKYDMCGAAGVLEAMELLVRKKVRQNLIAILVLAENVISPDAVKMGDVITTLAGKTVEIYNTDAEGRLVLADGITYAQKQGARLVIDLATLTYSAQAALGDTITGLFANDEDVCGRWMEAARRTGEPFWRLPLDPSYHRQLEWSICADFANYAPGRGGGASVAACFLEKFVDTGTQWIHLDMVGPSVVRSATEEMAEGASGVCIHTIAAFVEAMSAV